MTIKRNVGLPILVAAACSLGFVGAAVARPARHGAQAHVARHQPVQGGRATRGGVRFANAAQHGGYQPLVSDGPGSGFGFHRNPLPYRAGAAIARNRQGEAVRTAVISSALDSQPDGFGFYGDSVYGEGTNAAYGVFNGSDGYGSPYFAGYYGPGDGADYGVFGHAYSN